MNLKLSALSLLLFCFTLPINAQDRETTTHTIEDIKSIAISGNVDIHIKQGNSKTVKITASQKQYKKMKTKITANAVSVSCKSSGKEKPVLVSLEVQNLETIAGSAGADVYFKNTIKTKSLKIALSAGSDLSGSLEVSKLVCATSAGSDLDLKKVEANKVQMSASGGSDIVTKDMSAKKVNLVLSGGSDADLSGNCEDLNLVTSGGSDYEGNNFKTEKSNVVVSGGSDANIHVTEELSIVASGSSDVNCKGNPKIMDKKVSKGCDFNMK